MNGMTGPVAQYYLLDNPVLFETLLFSCLLTYLGTVGSYLALLGDYLWSRDWAIGIAPRRY